MKELFKCILLMLSFCLIREVKFFEGLLECLKFKDGALLFVYFTIYFLAFIIIITWIEDLFQK